MVKQLATYCKTRKQLVGMAVGNLYSSKFRKSRLVARDSMIFMLLLQKPTPISTWHTEIDFTDVDTFGAKKNSVAPASQQA